MKETDGIGQKTLIFLGLVAGLTIAPGAAAEITTMGPCPDSYLECLQSWKKARIRFLRSESGYLNLAGLFWLQEGKSTFGSDPANNIVFPENAASRIGVFSLENDSVEMIVNDDVDVRFANRRVSRMTIPDDTSGNLVAVTHGDFAWTIIKRDNRHAVRLRDFAHPSLQSFDSIDYYPIDPDLKIEGKFHPYDKPKIVNVGTVIEGLSYNPRSPGTVRFKVRGQQFELEAYDAAGELFFVFGDRTSGNGTYPAGRFLYANAPGDGGQVILDFNIAQNPPCAFNEFATCPVASSRNRLATVIEAGERFNPADH